jgi:hypothetical protein
MTTVNKTIAIGALPDRILTILLDVEDWPSWQAIINKVEVLERDPQGRPSRARLIAEAGGQNAVCVLLYEYTEQYRFEYFLIEGEGVTSNDASYAIAARDDGRFDVTINMRLEADWPVPADQVDLIIDGAIGALLEGLKQKAEQAA